MKISPARQFAFSVAATALLATAALAQPIDFKEVSLLVRAHEPESSIVQDVSQRKLLHSLTPAEEARLRKEGASDSLLRALRDSSVVLSPQEASAVEQDRAERAKMYARNERKTESGGSSDRTDSGFHVFDVSYGQPVNLSEWGGPDYEFAFECHRFAGEDIVEPVLTQAGGTYIDTATYLGAGRRADSTTVFDDRDYVSVMAYSAARPLKIDMHHPVGAKGVPYVMYPVYGAGGVSLFYIGATGGSVRLAVSTSRR